MRASESMMLALPSERELALDARPIPPAMIFCCSAASSAGGLVAMSSDDSTDASIAEEDGERWSECGESDAEDWTSTASSSEHDPEPRGAARAAAAAAPPAARYDALSWFERITLGEPRAASAARGADGADGGGSWWSLAQLSATAMGGARPAAAEDGPSPQQHVCATCGFGADQQVFFLRDRAFCSATCVEQHARDMDELRLLRSRKRARN